MIFVLEVLRVLLSEVILLKCFFLTFLGTLFMWTTTKNDKPSFVYSYYFLYFVPYCINLFAHYYLFLYSLYFEIVFVWYFTNVEEKRFIKLPEKWSWTHFYLFNEASQFIGFYLDLVRWTSNRRIPCHWVRIFFKMKPYLHFLILLTGKTLAFYLQKLR